MAFSWERSPAWGYGKAGDPWTKTTRKKPAASGPPPGFYDPSIDASVAATNRGFGDLQSDYIRDFGEPGTALAGRMGEDFLVGRGRLDRNQGYELADLMRGSSRSVADLQRDRQRGQEDYGSAIQGLERNYQRLGNSQTQAARGAGIVRGGTLTASQNRRDTNKAIDRAPIDTSFSRFLQDSAQAEQRMREDATTGQGRIGASYGDQRRDLDTSYSRGGEDSSMQLARALREALQYGTDANTLRAAQARQLGWPFR